MRPTDDALADVLDGLVDYAGLFPPAALDMRAAVENYARYRAGDHRAMLARFVVPAGRLEEFRAAAEAVTPTGAGAWPLAVLADASAAAALDAFQAAHGSRWRIDTVEAKAESAADIVTIAAALSPRYAVYVEVPVRDDPALLLTAIAAEGLRAKVRTGGVTAEAFPAPHAVVRFLAQCARLQVPFKATAGLHHPLRGEHPLTYAPDSARTTMYGFLNVFLAAAFLFAGRREAEVAPLLEERDADAVAVTPNGVTWRGLTLDRDTIRRARARFAGSFGSCSFEEPVADLTHLHLLPVAG